MPLGTATYCAAEVEAEACARSAGRAETRADATRRAARSGAAQRASVDSICTRASTGDAGKAGVRSTWCPRAVHAPPPVLGLPYNSCSGVFGSGECGGSLTFHTAPPRGACGWAAAGVGAAWGRARGDAAPSLLLSARALLSQCCCLSCAACGQLCAVVERHVRVGGRQDRRVLRGARRCSRASQRGGGASAAHAPDQRAGVGRLDRALSGVQARG